MTDPIRTALERLVEAIEGIELEGVPEVDDAISAARAALANAEPAPLAEEEVKTVLDELRDAAYDLDASDPAQAMLTRAAELLQQRHPAPGEVPPSGYAYRYPDGIRFNGGGKVNGCRPIEAMPYWFSSPVPATPPAEGEVAELAEWLGSHAADWEEIGLAEWADKCARTQALLEQRHPAPVAVSERPWKRDGWCDGEGKCWWGRAADDFCNPDWHYATWADVQEFCSDAMPHVSLPHNALPLPAGEGEA